MTYASGGLIQATDYNTLATQVSSQLGVGTGKNGLGQSVTSIAAVTAGVNTITAVQWTGLIQSTNNILLHEGQAAITPASVAAGDIITYYAAITTGGVTAYNNSGSTSLALSDGAANTTSYATAWGTTGSRSLVFTQSITFASGDAARYFFNAGGRIKLSCSRSGGSATVRNTDFTALATSIGSIQLGYNNTTKVGGSGTTTTLLNANNGGYWAGTGAYVTHFKQFDASAGYTTDFIQVEYYWSGTATNGGYPVLNIKTTWSNSHVQAYQDSVDGTCSTSLVVSSPATTYLANTWGTPTFSGSVAAV